jgi:hypothetical protein
VPHGGGDSKEGHEAAFAHGGYATADLVGKRVLVGEREDEVAIDEQGNIQLLKKGTGVGVLTRPAAIIPFSKLQAAYDQSGASPYDDYDIPSAPAQPTNERLPTFNAQPHGRQPPAYSGPRWSEPQPDASGSASPSGSLNQNERASLDRALGQVPAYSGPKFNLPDGEVAAKPDPLQIRQSALPPQMPAAPVRDGQASTPARPNDVPQLSHAPGVGQVVDALSRNSKRAADLTAAMEGDRKALDPAEFSRIYPGSGKTLAASDVAARAQQRGWTPQRAALEAVEQGYKIESAPLEMFDGQPRANEFAAPSATNPSPSSARHAATPDGVPTVLPTVAAGSSAAGGPAAQQEPGNGADKGSVPVEQRQDALFEAAGIKAPAGGVEPQAAKPDPLGSSADASAVKPKGAPEMVRTGDLLADTNKYIAELSAYKPENHNSRWKSIALTAVRSFLQGLSSGSLTQALGAMIFGIGYGAFHPQADEEFAKQHNLSQAEHAQAKEMARRMNTAKVQEAEADAKIKTQNASGEGDGQNLSPKRRSELMREYQARLKATGGKFDPKDARQVEIARILDFTPKDKPTKAGMNWQRVRNVSAGGRDHLVYLDFDENQKIVYQVIQPDGEQPLTPDVQREIQNQIQNAIQLENVNANRSRNGDVPLMINPPAASPAPAPSQPAPAETLPTFNSPSKPPVLVPVPGAKAPAPIYQRRGGGRSSRRAAGGSPSGGLDKYEESALRKAENDSAQSRARAEAARARGDDGEAAAHDEAARVAAETASKLKAKRSGRRSSDRSPSPRRGDPLGILD